MSQLHFRSDFSSAPVQLDDHVERLYNSKKNIEEYLQGRRKELNQLIDPVTGQEYFKPKIGRPPKFQKTQVNDFTFSLKQNLCIEQSKTKQLDLASKNRSSEILGRRKKARYFEIFSILNPFEYPKISAEVICTDSLDPEILRILMPLFRELEETREKIDFDEFYESVENLCRFLTPEERQVLLKEKHKQEVQFDSKRRSCSSAGKFYTKNIKFKEDVQAKVLAERMKKTDSELKECTFHPKTIDYRKIKNNHQYAWFLE